MEKEKVLSKIKQLTSTYFRERTIDEQTKEIIKKAFYAVILVGGVYVILDFVIFPYPKLINTEKVGTIVCIVVLVFASSALLIPIASNKTPNEKKFQGTGWLFVIVSFFYVTIFLLVHISGGIFSPFLGLYTLVMFGIFIISKSIRKVIFLLIVLFVIFAANFFFAEKMTTDIKANFVYGLKYWIIVFLIALLIVITEYFR